MGNLTKNISSHELTCHCGKVSCPAPETSKEVILLVQSACDHFASLLELPKVTLIINSASRCPSWNTHVYGAPNSQHLSGNAIDHYIKEVSLFHLHKFYHTLLESLGSGGLGNYHNFIHVDVRKNILATWSGKG